ncbi:glycosyltransferase family 2 protein [candidate division KSB1 bacterium]|nr:glycosyltransferase family 2 protein [candidate division KSB1 bacterium]
MISSPLVSIIIPHWRGADILLRCLQALREHTHTPHEIVIVDNGCDDGSIALAQQRFAHVKIVAAGDNLGFASGCNFGLRAALGKYAVLLNNDAVVTPGWLEPMVQVMEREAQIAACQPKILSLPNPGYFDYAGAAGGLVDFLGYPFCRGRIFATIEPDQHQYDEPAEIFWASGACCILRCSVLAETGLLDDAFFAHMEEIDLCWRMHLAGYRVTAVPQACVYHQAGSTLHAASPHKTYLNHRNALFLLLKNYETLLLWVIFPLRLWLDIIQAVRLLFTFNGAHAVMVFRAVGEVLLRLPELLRKRRQSRRVCRISSAAMRAKFYQRSIIWEYFIRRRTRCSELALRIK